MAARTSMGGVDPLPRSFYARPVLDVARDLLGAVLVTESAEGAAALRLVEVEAYAGPADPASHAWRGPTPRTQVMFGPAGHAYVYRSYGIHWCCNLVTGPDGEASAVLLRAAVPVDGLDLVRARRPGVAERDLARGPGRLCAAAGITGALDGSPVTGGGVVTVRAGERVPDALVRRGPRVGVSRAADRPWRLWVDGEPGVSAYRPGGVPRRRR